MENTITDDIVQFEKCFKNMREKRLVIYGTGRATERLLAGIDGFNIVGLLDKDTNKIGKEMKGIPIVDIEFAKKNGDCIIINTAEMYWNVIYKRIKNCNLPIFYKNGIQATEPELDIQKIISRADSPNYKSILEILEKRVSIIGLNNLQDICSYKDWGYLLWGPIVWSFLHYLCNKAETHGHKELLFLARDGYLLKEDYEYFITVNSDKYIFKAIYVPSSRRLTYVAVITDEESFRRMMETTFQGTLEQLLKVRFDICAFKDDKNRDEIIRLPEDYEKVKSYLSKYRKEISNEIAQERKEYIEYLSKLDIHENYGIVDTGFTGRIIYDLEQLVDKGKTRGYFFYGDKSDCNPYGELIDVCFQTETDQIAQNCKLRREKFLVETVFTAPHGMIKKISQGNEVYCENNTVWAINEQINEGIKEFILDAKNVKFCDGDSLLFDDLFGVMSECIHLEAGLQEKIRYTDNWAG